VGIGLLQLKYYYDDKEREKASALNREQHPISVTPSEINLNPLSEHSQLKVNSDLTVYNHTDDWYYQIWLKIVIDSPVITTKQITLYLRPSLNGKEWVGNDPPLVSTKVLCFRGLDKDHQKAFLCFIRDLNPKEKYPLKLMSDCPEKLQETQIHKALISIVGFKTEPAQIFEGQGEGAIKYTWPEAFTIEETLVLTKGPVDVKIE